jgi:DNA-binding response OmpR family regulator
MYLSEWEGYYMNNVLIVGHCDLDNPQITSLIEKNFSAKVTRVKLLKKAIGYLEKQDYDLVIINRIGAFDQESGLELIKEIKKGGRFNTPLMMVTNYKDQMDKAVKSGAVTGYGKDKLYDKETVELLSKYLRE